MKKLYIETYGCQMNVADSEVVASVMQMAGYELCEHEAEADAIFMNTCSVRENAENKIYARLDTLHAEQKKGRKVILGVLGCMAERVKEDLLENHHAQLVAGPDSYLNLPDMMAQAEAGNKAIDIALSRTETYRDILPSALLWPRSAGSSASCAAAITSVTTASCPTPAAENAPAMSKASSTKFASCNAKVTKKSLYLGKT